MSEERILHIILVLVCLGIAFYIIRIAPILDGNIKWAIMALAAVLAIFYIL